MICSIHFNDKFSLTDGYDDSLTDSDWTGSSGLLWISWSLSFVKWRNEESLEILQQ